MQELEHEGLLREVLQALTIQLVEQVLQLEPPQNQTNLVKYSYNVVYQHQHQVDVQRRLSIYIVPNTSN